MFDAIADAIENGTISNGTLKTLGSPTGSISEMTEKLIEIITPMAKIVLEVATIMKCTQTLYLIRPKF